MGTQTRAFPARKGSSIKTQALCEIAAVPAKGFSSGRCSGGGCCQPPGTGLAAVGPSLGRWLPGGEAFMCMQSHQSCVTPFTQQFLLSFPILTHSEALRLCWRCSVLGLCQWHGGWGSTLTSSGQTAPLPSFSLYIFAPLSSQIGAHSTLCGVFCTAVSGVTALCIGHPSLGSQRGGRWS